MLGIFVGKGLSDLINLQLSAKRFRVLGLGIALGCQTAARGVSPDTT
jgi:hypothetical protein